MMNRVITLAFAGVLLFSPAFSEELPTGAGTHPAATPTTSPKGDSHMADIRALIDQGKVSEAVLAAKKWIKADKKSDKPFVAWSEALIAKKAYKKAISVAAKALDRNAASSGAYLCRGKAYEAMKNWMEAANEYRAALLAEPNLTPATEGLARVNSNLSVPQLDVRQTAPDGHR